MANQINQATVHILKVSIFYELKVNLTMPKKVFCLYNLGFGVTGIYGMKSGVSQRNSQHWAHLDEAGIEFGIWFLYQTYRLFGKLPFRIILYPIISYFFLFRRSARTASFEYLTRLNESSVRITPSTIQVIKHFVSFGESLLDKILSHTGRYTLQNVTIIDREPIQAHLNRGQGLVFFTAHIGSLEVSRALAQFRGIPMTILVHTANSEKFNRIIKRVNPNAHVNLMQVESFGSAEAIILSAKIQAGEVVIIAADRTPISGNAAHMISVPFFGKAANFPSGPYILAHLLQCPIYSVFCTLVNGHYELRYIHFSEKIVLPRKERSAALSEYAQQFAHVLEQQCRRTPLQWFNFYKFWQ